MKKNNRRNLQLLLNNYINSDIIYYLLTNRRKGNNIWNNFIQEINKRQSILKCSKINIKIPLQGLKNKYLTYLYNKIRCLEYR